MSTRYNTGNPIESTDVRDMSDNAKNLDLFSNSSDMAFDDRFGVERKTIHGMNSEFNSHILNMGFARIGTFASGATLTNPRQTLLWDIANGGDGQEYGWSGTFAPHGKIVPPSSSPTSTGGIAIGAWVSRFDPLAKTQIREALRRSYAEAGYNLVDGSFEAGGVLANDSDVLLQERTGKAFSGPAGTVDAGTDPTLSGSGYVPRSDALLRAVLFSQEGASNVRFAPELPNSEAIPVSNFLSKTSPLSYGAKFNGIDDDTAGINKAIKAKGPNSYCVIQFPQGATAKILGTVLIPSGVEVDLNGNLVTGSGSNVMFEGGKWVGSNVVSSFNDAPEATLTVDASVGNGIVQQCESAVRVNNWVAGCRVHNIRAVQVKQLLHEKRSFYCEFYNLQAWDPSDGTLLPCFNWDGAVQAMGVKRCFAGGYTIGHQIRGPGDVESFDTCASEGCVIGLYITGNPAGGGGTTGITIRNWYFENNDNAIKADPAYTYEKIDIDNCFFNENYVILDGPSIRSGRFGRMNKIKTSVAKPGNFNMLGNQAGIGGFVIELDEISDSTNRISPTIDTTNRYFVGPNVRIERVVSITDMSGTPYARNLETQNLPVLRSTGRQYGTVPVNTVPFCETFYGEPNLLVKTQIPYQDFAMFSYNINVVDDTGSYWVRGVVMGDQVFPMSAGQKTVAIVNGGGFSQLNISTFIGAATYRGVVKLL